MEPNQNTPAFALSTNEADDAPAHLRYSTRSSS